MKNIPEKCSECDYISRNERPYGCEVSRLKLFDHEVLYKRPVWCKLAFKQKVMFKKSKLIEA